MVQNIYAVSLVGLSFSLLLMLLLNLPVTLPELVGQTNMDQQSVNRLREELLKLTSWLAKKATNYFVSEYETPNQEYIEKARNA
jgi:mortality factor 4-like protein 1